MSLVSGPVVKIISHSTPESFYSISGSKIHFNVLSGDSPVVSVCCEHSEGKKWTSVAALSVDEKYMAVCDEEKNLVVFEISDMTKFTALSVPMRLAKTATSVKFTNFPSETTLLVADKFGDVLRFQLLDEFDRWARESQLNSKTLSIHTKKQRIDSTAAIEEDETEESDAKRPHLEESSSEAHHCTIIGHISMVTDLQVLPICGGSSLIVTCDRDEKVRLTRSDFPERIHSFALGHTEFVGSLAVCEAKRSIFSAGGDKFVLEWCLEGPEGVSDDVSCLTLRQKNKIPISGMTGESVVQECKVNAAGDCLLVLVDRLGLLVYTLVDGEWAETKRIEDAGISAIDFSCNGYFYATWSPSEGSKITSSSLNLSFPCNVDMMSVEDGEGIIALLSKNKLRKDIERIDWKQKKHTNQKPRD